MPLIFAKETWQAKTVRRCATCRIEMGGHQWRLYGYGVEGDKPYVIWICPPCASKNNDVLELVLARTKKKAGNDVPT